MDAKGISALPALFVEYLKRSNAYTVENPILFMYQFPELDEPLPDGHHWNPCLYTEVFWNVKEPEPVSVPTIFGLIT